MAIKFKKQEFRLDWQEPVSGDRYKKSVNGIVYGSFGIENGTTWITHLPTGRKMNEKPAPSKREARRMVEELMAIDVDWEKVDNQNGSKITVGEKRLADLIWIIVRYGN